MRRGRHRSKIFGYLALLSACLVFGADDPLTEARLAFEKGAYADAVRLLEQARERSGSCNIPFYLGLAHYRLKRLDQAIIAFRSAAECDPKLLEAHIALGEAYAEKSEDNLALAAFENALRQKPDHAGALRAAGALYVKHQMNEHAIRVLEKLVDIEKGDVQTLANLGAVYAATTNFEGAERQFEQALRLNPAYPSALTGLGNVYLKTGKIQQSVELLSDAAKLAPQAYEPRFLRAAAYNQLGRYGEAEADLKAALERGGNDPEIYYHLARSYRGLGREDDRKQALAQFTAARAKSNEELEAHREAGRLLERAKPLVESGDLNGAIPLLEKARNLHPDNIAVLFRLAGLYYDVQRDQEARRYIQEAIDIAPSEWLYHYLLGLIEKRSANWQRARVSLETAVRLNPSAADAYNQLGDLAMRGREFRRAVENFEQAAKLAPDEAAYRFNLQAARRATTESR